MDAARENHITACWTAVENVRQTRSHIISARMYAEMDETMIITAVGNIGERTADGEAIAAYGVGVRRRLDQALADCERQIVELIQYAGKL